jgi:hypothetical protein
LRPRLIVGVALDRLTLQFETAIDDARHWDDGVLSYSSCQFHHLGSRGSDKCDGIPVAHTSLSESSTAAIAEEDDAAAEAALVQQLELDAGVVGEVRRATNLAML